MLMELSLCFDVVKSFRQSEIPPMEFKRLLARRKGPRDEWRNIRNMFRSDVCTYGASTKTFVQYYGSDDLNVHLLRLPLVGFLPTRTHEL
jgi:hypothetical protein